MKTLTLMFLLVVCALPAFADKKDRDWKTGKVIDTESHGYTTYGGTTTNGQVNNDGSYRGTSTPATWHHKEYTFAVEGEDMIYVASHTLSFRWSKEASVTVNAP